MANKYLNRRFTVREIVLLVVLLVVIIIGLYFGLVYYPIRQRTQELDAEREQLQEDLADAQIERNRYDDMQKELEEINKSEGLSTEMPQYNNNAQQETLSAHFSAIFAGLDENAVNIVFSQPQLTSDKKVYTRSVRLSFSVTSETKGDSATVYEKTRSVLHALLHTGFRCQMTSLNIGPQGRGDDLLNADVSVSTTIVFYERA